MYEKLEKNNIDLYKKQLMLDQNNFPEKSKTIEDVVALIEEISVINSKREEGTSTLGMVFHPVIAKEHIESLRAYWAYRKLIGRDGYNGPYPFEYYDDFFIGKQYVTSKGYQFIKNRCSECKLIRDKAILLAKNKYSEEDLISVKEFFNCKKKLKWKIEFIQQTEFFYINIPLYTNENKEVELKQYESSPYFDNINFHEKISDENRVVLANIFCLNENFDKNGYSDYFPLLTEFDFTKKFIIDHSCFNKDSTNIYVNKLIIDNIKDLTSTYFTGGLLTNKKMETNNYYHVSSPIVIPLDDLFVERKLANSVYEKLLSNKIIDPISNMTLKEKRNYYIKQALQEGYLNDVIDERIDGIAILNIYKQDLFDKLAKLTQFNQEQKSLFKSNVKTNEHFKDNPEIRKYIKMKSGRPSKK